MEEERTTTTVSLQALSEQLNRVERYALLGAKSVLDLDEVILLTGLSKGHLYRLTSERKIPHYKKNNRLVFKKSELEAWLLDNRVLTVEDVESSADTYVATRKR